MAGPPQSFEVLLPYGEEEYSEAAAQRIGQAFARLGVGVDWLDDSEITPLLKSCRILPSAS
jgi:hypothetical protein